MVKKLRKGIPSVVMEQGKKWWRSHLDLLCFKNDFLHYTAARRETGQSTDINLITYHQRYKGDQPFSIFYMEMPKIRCTKPPMVNFSVTELKLLDVLT